MHNLNTWDGFTQLGLVIGMLQCVSGAIGFIYSLPQAETSRLRMGAACIICGGNGSISRSWHISCLNNNIANLKLAADSIGDNHN